MSEFLRIEDLVVYQKLCELHIDTGDLPKSWPTEEKYELGVADSTFVQQLARKSCRKA